MGFLPLGKSRILTLFVSPAGTLTATIAHKLATQGFSRLLFGQNSLNAVTILTISDFDPSK
jgi:hypothetical protein